MARYSCSSTAQKTLLPYLKKGLWNELPLPLILIRTGIFKRNISIPRSKNDQKTPKTTANRQKTPITQKTIFYLKNGWLYKLR